MRSVNITRNTRETQIDLSLNLDGKGVFSGSSSIGFLDHMLELFARHGRFDVTIEATGDCQVDDHHLVEDVGIVLGQAFAQALGDSKGITRYGNFLIPMDETLIMVAIDISGRATLNYQLELSTPKVGTFDTELVEEFFQGFVRSSGMTVHLHQMYGKNTHHIIEATFKGFGRALKQGVAIDPDFADEIPSTKGLLT